MAEERSVAFVGGVLDKVRYPGFAYSPVEAHLAAALIQSPEIAMREPVATLAARTSVSVGSIVRFARRLGFSGYRDLKLAIARDLGRADHMRLSASPTGEGTSLERSLHQQQSVLALAARSIDSATFEAAAATLAHAAMIELAAAGATASLAEFALFNFTMLGLRARFLRDPWDQAGAARLLGRDDVLLAVSFSGRTRGIVDAARYARAACASVVAVTCNQQGPLLQHANTALVIPTKNRGDSDFDEWSARCGLFALMNTLVHETGRHLAPGQLGQRRGAWASARFAMRYPDAPQV